MPGRCASALDTLLDRAVLPGYSRLGHAVRARTLFTGARADPRPDALHGRTAVVTGGSAGLGLATVAGLARLGARVHLLVRDPDRGRAACAAVAAQVPGPAPEVLRCDVADLADVRRAAAALVPLRPQVLVHNAGVLAARRETTAEGHERTLATHVLGPHLLTALLADVLGREGRVIWVSSGGMYTRRLGDPAREPRRWSGTDAYARTKRMQVVLAAQWAVRRADRGPSVHAVHPGWADTPGLAASLPRFRGALRPLLRTAAQGADTTVWLAAAPAAVVGTGRFWHDRAPRPEHVLPWTREGAAERERLWRFCVAATGAG